MAVPFAFPEENNDVEVIIRQLSLLLNRLAVEFKKQRNENIQLRARNKLQSGIRRQISQGNQESSSSVSVGDSLLSAIATCKRFASPDGRVVIIPRREFDDAKTDSSAQSYDKSELYRTDNLNLTEVEEERGALSFIRLRLRSHRIWWSWLAPSTLTRNPFWTTAVICVVGWHLLR
ncbi:hypothetical protein HHI36_023349 [Cryptolaemus montrouzieri]|uniref:Uncharacterized protein n=1 Tax=Cryptolaemus montrouzieri TaxID=559131 RepID=A0ABD2PG52_9CUCU